jgi:hypothetical protein
LLGGRVPDQPPFRRTPILGGGHWSPSEETRPQRHYLAKTCVVVVSKVPRAAATLCGSGNFCTRYNAPAIPATEPFPDQDFWHNAEGLQPSVFRFRVPRHNARRIERGSRVYSHSNRVQGFVGNQPQFDPEIDNVETPHITPVSEPPVIASRSFRHPARDRHLGSPQGFGILNLANNQLGIIDFLQKNWEQLTKTTTPFQDTERSAVWILPDEPPPRSRPAGTVDMMALAKQVAVELGVPTDQVYCHVSVHCLNLWSRWGPPNNLPSLQGDGNAPPARQSSPDHSGNCIGPTTK